MFEKILKAKHWQIFILIYGFPGSFILIVGMMQELGFDPKFSLLFFPILLLSSIIPLFLMFWTIGIKLNKKVPSAVNLNIKRFKIAFFVPLIYILSLISYLLFSLFYNNLLNRIDFGIILKIILFGVIVIFAFLSIYSMFYMFYFCAKTIRSIELKREAVFSEFNGEFLLFWFYIVGVWILQPKLNDIVN